MEQTKILSEELKALSSDDLEQISGSGDETSVVITDDQCEKIKLWYDNHPTCVGQGFRVVTNYGGVCPRSVFVAALSHLDGKSSM